MKTRGFVYGSILMIIVNFIVRSVDFIYDVMLSKFIGAEGLGLFQMAKSVLMIFIVISTAGIPTAISRLVAEYKSRNNYHIVRKILTVSILLAFFFGIIFSTVIGLFGNNIALGIYKNNNMITAIYFLIPSVILIPLTVVFRGYYYGLRIIMIPNISQVIEHVAQLLIVFGMLYFAYPIDPVTGATIAVCGIAIGEVFDLIWLTAMLKQSNKGITYIASKRESRTKILKQIFSISAPIAVSDVISVIFRFANSIFIPRSLMKIGFTNSEAVATLGRISGMTMPLIALPFIVTGAIAINLVPNISENMALKRYNIVKHDIKFSIKMTLLAAIPLTGLYIFYSNHLGYLIYGDIKVSQFIKIMAYGTIFMALEHTFSGILNGLNKQITATKNRLIGLIVQVFCIYSLVSHPKFGINGFFIGFLLSGFIIFILDKITMIKKVKLVMDYKDLILKPVIATIVMLITIYYSINFLDKFNFSDSLVFFSSVVIGGITYLIILLKTKAIPTNIYKRMISQRTQ
ncbi:polysaccharide biosynthesis protein [Schnuerera sp. xch1]|uniref:putative polysaccharide biosynthesis protein n=1 Tax=Schnuerera sp. xch1 TaxID=2874283 RepID=UPI001CBBCDEA|nr:polysaccharide biosynthesis protein [Schnuerera sp. xch1]MBZ2176045.1 polysaccharide biosynthesis protein [Schnuerera sp. xch1]